LTAPLDPNSLLLFLHVPKTAGTTLKEYVYSVYEPPDAPEEGEGGYFHYGIYDYYPSDELGEAPPADLQRIMNRPDLRVVVGHFSYGLHALQPKPATYLTILRDPIDRVVSTAAHNLRWSGKEEREVTVQDLERYLLEAQIPDLDNGQTRRLSGVDAAFGRCTPAMLASAQEHVRAHFSAVGLTERFEESLVLFARVLGWPLDLYFTPQQVDSRRASRAELSADVREMLAERNHLDVALYDWASAGFEDRVEREGPGFADDVAALEELRAGVTGR
jgi:hypothetical protein